MTGPKGGRPQNATCAYPPCGNPPRPKALTGPASRYCSYECNHQHYREEHLYSQYQMSSADYDALLAKQGGKCAICRTDDPGPRGQNRTKGAFDVDHDHETGRVRGLLCGSCNRMLGQANDRPDVLLAGAVYLLAA